MSVVLSVRDVVKTFGAVRAVDGVSFTVQRGTITGLLGRNGAGKTTTIRMITGVFFPTPARSSGSAAIVTRATASAICRKSAGSTGR